MSNLSTVSDTNQIIRDIILTGNIGSLKPEHRADYVIALAKHVGVDPITRPFDLLTLQGKTVVYANKSCTDQLRVLHGVSIRIVSREQVGDIYVVTAEATDKHGRTDSDIGSLNVKGLAGEALSNAMMKAGTKAKRRVTLSLCGLGQVSDESEVDGIKAEAATSTMPEGSRKTVDDLNAKIKPRSKPAQGVVITKPDDEPSPTDPENVYVTVEENPESLEDWAKRTDKIAEAERWEPDVYEEMRREAFRLKGASPWQNATPAQRAEFEAALKDGKLRAWWAKKPPAKS